MTNPGGSQSEAEKNQSIFEAIRRAIASKTKEQIQREFAEVSVRQAADEIKRDLDSAKPADNKRNKRAVELMSITGKREKMTKVTDAVMTTLVAIYEKKLPIAPGSEQVVSAIATTVNLVDVTVGASPYIYKILERGLNNGLKTTDELLQALDSIKILKDVDEQLFVKLAGNLEIKAALFGLTAEQSRRFQEFKQISGATPEAGNPTASANWNDLLGRINARQADYDQWYEASSKVIQGITPGLYVKIRPAVEREIRAKYAGQGVEEDSIIFEIEQETQQRGNLAVGVLRRVFAPAYAPVDNTKPGEPNEIRGRQAVTEGFRTELGRLLSQGLITPEQHATMMKISGEVQTKLDTRTEDSGAMRRNLVDAARGAGVTVTPKAEKLLSSLSDPSKFVNLASSPEYSTGGKIDFGKVYADIKDVCEQVLNVIDTHKNEFFEHAFNPMYHGHFYEVLIGSIQSLAQELSSNPNYKDVANQIVTYTDIVQIADPNEENIGVVGKRQLAYAKHDVKTTFHEALTFVMTDRMDRLLRVYKYLHNTNRIADEGMGFEQLAKYAEQISTADIDWFFLEDKEMADGDMSSAYNHYIRNLKQVLYLNNRVTTNSFGQLNAKGMDVAQEMTYLQLKAEWRARNPGKEFKEDSILDKKFSRRIKLASGVAKGYTGEFWGVLQSSSMPIKVGRKEVGKDSQGNPIYIYKFNQSFEGTSDVGFEKMSGSIDIEKIWRRFNVPAYFPAMAYLFQPRDLNTSYEPWDHKKVYDLRKMYEDCYFQGATDEYLKFYEKYMTLAEAVKQKMVGAYSRAGWRIEEYRAFIHMNEDGKYNFAKTLADLMSVGSLPVKAFLENLDYGKIDGGTYQLIMGAPMPTDFTRNNALTSEFKQKCQEEFLYKWMFDNDPTRVMGLERRLYTPRGEKLVMEDLWDYLVKQDELIAKGYDAQHADAVRQTIMPFYISVIDAVQNIKRTQSRQSLRQLTAGASIGDLRSMIATQALSQADLNSGPVKAAVNLMFQEFKMQYGRIFENDYRIDVEFMYFDKFYKSLPKFFAAMKASINKNRVERALRPGEVASQTDHAKITLAKRFMKWQRLGIIDYDFGGEDLDLGRFYMQTGGTRMVARYAGETNALVGVISDVPKYIDVGMQMICNGHWDGQEQLTKMTSERLSPVLNKMKAALVNVSRENGDEFAVRMISFLNRAVEADHSTRMFMLGSVVQMANRNWGGGEASFAQDFFKSFLDRPTKALNADESEGLVKTQANDAGLAWDEVNIPAAGYKEMGVGPFKRMVPDIYETEKVEVNFGIFGGSRIIEVPVYETVEKTFGIGPLKFKRNIKVPKLKESAKNKFHVKMLKNIEGHRMRDKIKDRYMPIITMVLLLMMIQLALAANKKNKK